MRNILLILIVFSIGMFVDRTVVHPLYLKHSKPVLNTDLIDIMGTTMANVIMLEEKDKKNEKIELIVYTRFLLDQVDKARFNRTINDDLAITIITDLNGLIEQTIQGLARPQRE